MTRGQVGKTTLTDGRTQLPTQHYRVATLAVAQPGEADGDGIDDITELNAPSTMNPLNPARSISFLTLTYGTPQVSRTQRIQPSSMLPDQGE